MKKRGLMIWTLLSLVLISTLISANAITGCNLEVSLINQDPYPAIPGDYVELVFQVDGVGNPECGEISFELEETFPISFDQDEEPKVTIESGFYEKNFGSFLIVPYKVRVDEEALDGDNPIEVEYSYKSTTEGSTRTQEFNLNIEDTRVDFEIFVKDYYVF